MRTTVRTVVGTALHLPAASRSGTSRSRRWVAALVTTALAIAMIAGTTASSAQATVPLGPVLEAGASLSSGQSMQTPDGRLRLTLQTDGNLGLFSGNRVLWNLGQQTAGRSLAIANGKLSLLSSTGQTVWSVGSPAQPADRLVLQEDGNVVLYAGSAYTWATNTTLNRLEPGQSLRPGSAIYSNDRRFRAAVDGTGRLVISGPGRDIYVTAAAGGSAVLTMNGSGALALSSPEGLAWGYFGTSPGSYATIQDDGNFAVYSASTAPLWWTGFGPALRSGESMSFYERLISPNGLYHLIVQPDGNVGFFGPSGLIWMSGTQSPGARLVNQTDGNVGVYSATGTPLWASNTASGSPGSLSIDDSGVLWIRNANGGGLWAAWAVAPAPDPATALAAAINGYRARNGLPSLLTSPELQSNALGCAQALANANNLHHCYTNEIVQYNTIASAEEWLQAYINSPAHNALMLNTTNSRQGVGVVLADGRWWNVVDFA